MTVSTDPIADMFTRIRNSAAVGKSNVTLPHSKIKESVAQLLVDNGFLGSVSVAEDDGFKTLNIDIFNQDRAQLINHLARLSTPGRRIYVKSKEIPQVKRGRGLVILSTSKGLMTGQTAASQRLGGELICEVY